MDAKLAELEKFEGPEKISCKELTAAEGYPIIGAQRIKTRFGETVMVNITMPGGEERVAFLPSRFVSMLTNAEIESLSSNGYRIRSSGMTNRSINVTIFK